jgi:hypothetical protein
MTFIHMSCNNRDIAHRSKLALTSVEILFISPSQINDKLQYFVKQCIKIVFGPWQHDLEEEKIKAGGPD